MRRIAGIDLPETKEEAVYQQLAHDGKFEHAIASSLSRCIVNPAFEEAHELIKWIWEQTFFPVYYGRNRSTGSITIKFVGSTARLNIGHEHQAWYYTLAGHCAEYVVRDMINECN
jgi:hypothetical protein